MSKEHPPTVVFRATEARRLGELLSSEAGQQLGGEHYQFEPLARLAAALIAGAPIEIKPE